MQEIAQESLARLQLDHRVDILRAQQAVEPHTVYDDKAELHCRRGIGMNAKGVACENGATNGVDDPQLDHRRHQHRNNNQAGASVAYKLNNRL